jgi:hypothetical protein
MGNTTATWLISNQLTQLIARQDYVNFVAVKASDLIFGKSSTSRISACKIKISDDMTDATV